MSMQKQKSRLSSPMEIRAGILHEDRKGCSHGKRKLEKITSSGPRMVMHRKIHLQKITPLVK